MDCLSFQATLSPYYDGEVTANARETFESHLGCWDECSVAPFWRCLNTIVRKRVGFRTNGKFETAPQVFYVLCQVTELKNSLAASWDFEQRTTTIVGYKTAEEIDDWGQRLTTVFPKQTRASPHPKFTFEDLYQNGH